METTRDLVLVGEHNPHRPEPEFALYPLPPLAAGGRLARVLGLDGAAYLRTFPDRRNLMPHDYDVSRWRVRDARARARAILRTVPRGGRLVLVGSRVAAAFGVDFRSNLCEPRFMQLSDGIGLLGRGVLVIPHPSGRSREWNDRATAPRVREAFERLKGELT